jgi:high-affinity K+ transport system ATPase subunit B
MGLKIIMCTGDNRRTAESVARELGIDEVRAEVMPDEKIEIVKRLKASGAIVAMAGDGINDAPALAEALTKMAGDEEMRARFGKAARALVEEKFSAEAIGNATVALYQSLVPVK